jgi:hypothetical protein
MNEKIPTIDFLHREKDVKETSKTEMFKRVLNKCVEKIVYTNRHTDKTFVIFEVPKILLGYPSYDMKTCLIFLINQLSSKGYYVSFLEPFYLYIDWGSKSQPEYQVNRARDTRRPSSRDLNGILSQFPSSSKIEIVYENDTQLLKKKRKKKK